MFGRSVGCARQTGIHHPVTTAAVTAAITNSHVVSLEVAGLMAANCGIGRHFPKPVDHAAATPPAFGGDEQGCVLRLCTPPCGTFQPLLRSRLFRRSGTRNGWRRSAMPPEPAGERLLEALEK